jgi:hypothetical protein
MEARRRDGARYHNEMLSLMVIISCAVEDDGRKWVHLSVSHLRRIPTWRELVEVRDTFLGDVYTYQVIPPTEKYINIDSRVLHLWHCLDEVPLPDFTAGGDSL